MKTEQRKHYQVALVQMFTLIAICFTMPTLPIHHSNAIENSISFAQN
jgi:hypothetical protein